MKISKNFLALILSFSLAFVSFLTLPIQVTTAQDGRVALQRGYRTGYSDGYMAGYRDVIDSNDKSYMRHSDYTDANRAYNADYGTIEDYRDGYKQGFESGYDAGFGKKTFEATIPPALQRRGDVANVMPPPEPVSDPIPAEPEAHAVAETEPATETPAAAETPADESIQKASFQPVSDAVIIIPKDTELLIELDEPLSTDKNTTGDDFRAKIVSPVEIAGAVVEGRVDKITKPGHIKRRPQMLLSFDRIILNEQRWSNFDAMLVEVVPIKGDNVKKVDNEGNAIGKRSMTKDAIKVGSATGGGATIGALTGGPVGAAVGAGVGAAFGVGAVVIDRGKNIRLNKSQQLRIRTSYETKIR